jgi:hypothetical protein
MYKSAWVLSRTLAGPRSHGALAIATAESKSPSMGGPRTIKAWKEAKKKRKKGTLVKYQYHQWSRVETSDAFDPARTWRA